MTVAGAQTNGNQAPSRVLLSIAGYYPSLNEAERRVADFVSQHPDEAKGMPVTRLAERSGVSQTTVVRFCRALGYEGYADFKLALIEDLVPYNHNQALPDVHSEVERDDSLSTLVEKVLSMDMHAIDNTLKVLDLGEFARAVKAIQNARVVEILGVGSSLPVAMDLYYRLLRSGAQSRISVDSHMQAINAGLLQAGDVALAVSHSGEARNTLDAIELAKEAGATTVCVTNFPRSTLARICDISLVTSAGKTRWVDEAITARIVQLAVFDALCVALAREKSKDVLPKLEQIEKAVIRKR